MEERGRQRKEMKHLGDEKRKEEEENKKKEEVAKLLQQHQLQLQQQRELHELQLQQLRELHELQQQQQRQPSLIKIEDESEDDEEIPAKKGRMEQSSDVIDAAGPDREVEEADTVEMTTAVDHFSVLPGDCLLPILRRLERPDLCSVALTSRRLRRLLLDSPEIKRRFAGGFTLQLERPEGAELFRTSAQERGAGYSYHRGCDTSADGDEKELCGSKCRLIEPADLDTSGLDYGGPNGHVAYVMRLYREQLSLRPPATALHPSHNYEYKCQTYEVNKDADAERLTNALYKESPSTSRNVISRLEGQYRSPQKNLKTQLQKTSMRPEEARRTPLEVVFRKIASFASTYQIDCLALSNFTIDSSLVATLCSTFDGTQKLRSLSFLKCDFESDYDDVIKLHDWMAAVGCENFYMLSSSVPDDVPFPSEELLIALPKLQVLRVYPEVAVVSAAAVERVAELTRAADIVLAPDDLVSVIKARCSIRLRGRHIYFVLSDEAEGEDDDGARAAWLMAALGDDFEPSARFRPSWASDADLYLVHIQSGLHCRVECYGGGVTVGYALDL